MQWPRCFPQYGLFAELGAGGLAVGVVLVVLIPFLRKLITDKTEITPAVASTPPVLLPPRYEVARENCGGESRPCAATSEAQRAGLLLPARAFFASSITRCWISRGISS